MERLYQSKTLAALSLCMLALSACSSDDEPEYTPSEPEYYVFSLNLVAEGTDQTEMVSTYVSFTDGSGKITDVPMLADSQTFKGAPDKNIPGSTDITVTQTLKPGAKTDKDSYNLGLSLTLTVTTVNTDGQVIDHNERTLTNVSEVLDYQLSSYLPQSDTYTVTVNRDGKLDISLK